MRLYDLFLIYREDLNNFEKDVCGEIIKQSFITENEIPSKIVVKCMGNEDLFSLNKFLNNVGIEIKDSFRFSEQIGGQKYLELNLKEKGEKIYYE